MAPLGVVSVLKMPATCPALKPSEVFIQDCRSLNLRKVFWRSIPHAEREEPYRLILRVAATLICQVVDLLRNHADNHAGFSADVLRV